jgi:hypothetical protein
MREVLFLAEGCREDFPRVYQAIGITPPGITPPGITPPGITPPGITPLCITFYISITFTTSFVLVFVITLHFFPPRQHLLCDNETTAYLNIDCANSAFTCPCHCKRTSTWEMQADKR